MHPLLMNCWCNTNEGRLTPVEKYIGLGFIFLCLAVLVGISGIVGYHLLINKEKIDISPVTNINQSHKNSDE